jgi:hypothetical protein
MVTMHQRKHDVSAALPVTRLQATRSVLVERSSAVFGIAISQQVQARRGHFETVGRFLVGVEFDQLFL